MHTLLLADDSVTIQRVIELTFAAEDVQIVAVSDGNEAIARLDASPPDIVLADTGVRGRNGYEVARYVKQSPRLAHIPVVLLTGAFEAVDPERAREVGCDGILAKPFEPQLVISRVHELLARPQNPPPALDEGLSALFNQSAPSGTLSNRAPAGDVEQSAKAGELDEYFDRLEAAFADRLSATPDAAVPPASPSTTSDPEPGERSVPAKGSDDEAWDVSRSEERDDPSAASSAEPTPEAADGHRGNEEQTDRSAPAPGATADAPVPALEGPSTSDGSPVGLPALAEAFAALLVSEQRDTALSPVTAASDPGRDDLVEQVTRRVLAQLSERLVRETVADLVSEIAERLVREEIERIKASIK